MHILLIHQNYAALGEPGGTRHDELARYLAGRGHRVTVVTSGVSYLTGTSQAAAGQPDRQGVEIRRAYTYPALHRSFVHRVFSFISFMVSSFIEGLRVPGVDLVWGTSPPIFQGATAWALARLKGVPFVFEVRDLWPAFAVAVGVLKNPLLIRLSEWLERFLYRRADQVMVNSPGFIEHVLARSGRIPVMVPNGADPRMFVPEAEGRAFRQANGLEGKFIAMYAGAHGLSNDLEVLLQAAHALQNRLDIAIVFLGDGKEKPNLLAQAEALGLQNVHFLPPLPKTEIPSALAAAGVCIAILKPVPMYATVYPNKVFDYMAAGRPVALAIDGVIRSVVEETQSGLYIPPGDANSMANAIAFFADNPHQARQMGQNGRQAVELRFDRAVLAAQLEALFRSVTAC